MRVLREQGICDLAVADSSFRVVSIDLATIGSVTVAYPWSLASAIPGVHLHVVSWEYFGADGLN